jgi:hypothetical protein
MKPAAPTIRATAPRGRNETTDYLSPERGAEIVQPGLMGEI